MKTPLPSAKVVRDVLGHVDIGAYRVSRNMLSAQQNWRFLWRVLGPEEADGTREIVEEFPSYREAVSFARKLEKLRQDTAALKESMQDSETGRQLEHTEGLPVP